MARLAELRERVGKLTLRLRKRLLDAAEAQVQLGALAVVLPLAGELAILEPRQNLFLQTSCRYSRK